MRLSLILAAASLLLPFSVFANQDKPRPKIWGISSVTLSSTDFSAARQFYSTLLHQPVLECHWCEELPMNWEGMALSSQQKLFFESPSKGKPSDHVSVIMFATDDIVGMQKYLKEKKIKIDRVREPNNNPASVYSSKTGLEDPGIILFLRDPEGHRIGFVQKAGELYPLKLHTNDLRIIHAGIIVKDVAVEDHFYRDVLGFHLYWHGGRAEGRDDWVAMQVPDGTDWVEYMLNIPADADQRTIGVASHIAIGVTDIRDTQGRLMEDGVRLTEEPVLGLDGKWQLNAYDPDKTRIEFMEFKPKAKPCCSEFTGTQPGPE